MARKSAIHSIHFAFPPTISTLLHHVNCIVSSSNWILSLFDMVQMRRIEEDGRRRDEAKGGGWVVGGRMRDVGGGKRNFIRARSSWLSG